MMNAREVLGEELFQELKAEYFTTLTDQTEVIEDHLYSIEKNGYDKKVLKEVFRNLHNLKGASGALGFTQISSVLHRIEDLISLVMEGNATLLNEIIESCFKLLKGILSLKDCFQKNSSDKEIMALTDSLLKHKQGKKQNVLFVETSKTMRKFLRDHFIEQQYNVAEANTTLDALNRIITEPVDILITSYENNYLDGLNLIRMIKANAAKKSVTCILITSHEVKDCPADMVIRKDNQFIQNILHFLNTGKVNQQK